ncbi:hypothetical protein DXT90_06960 [Agrobacterium tumefaciens]|nr:hypothetical protein [Agrobacterium tumefaciens]
MDLPIQTRRDSASLPLAFATSMRMPIFIVDVHVKGNMGRGLVTNFLTLSTPKIAARKNRELLPWLAKRLNPSVNFS